MSDRGRRQRLITTIRERSRPFLPIPTGYPSRLDAVPGIRWVVFDIYGTLLASTAGEIGIERAEAASPEIAFSTVTRRYGRDGVDSKTVADAFYRIITEEHERHRSETVSQPEVDIRTVWRKIAAQFFRSEPDQIALETIALDFELAVNPVWPMPHATELIETLRQRSYSLGIVSNAQFYTPLIVEALFGSPISALGFTAVSWSYDEAVAKPSPEIFNRFLSRIPPEISPAEILYVGNDMRNDIATATACGLRTALFAGDRRSLRLREDDPDSRHAVPEIVINDLRELIPLLPSLSGLELQRKGTVPCANS